MQTEPAYKAPLYSSRDLLRQYMLVAHPDEATTHKLGMEHRACSHLYGEVVTPALRPFIAIADFLAKEEMEETLIRWMQRICCRQSSFIVTLNNYGGFPPHTIYVQIQDPLPLQQVGQQLKVIDSYICPSDCPPVRVATTPFLTVARPLSTDSYSKALKAYQLKAFHHAFAVNELVLLKRDHYLDECRRVHVFRLLPAENN